MIKKSFTVFVGLLIFWATGALAADPLKSMQGEKRPVLLFSKSRSFAPLDKQIDLLRDFRPDLDERDMIVLSTTGSQETAAAIGYVSIDRGTARELRKRFGPAPNGLTVILVGKDGTETARWQQVVDPQVIFDLIDSMPMRPDEPKRQVETQ